MMKYYKNLGYDIPYNNAVVKINIKDLSKCSSIRIECKCDVCGGVNKISYKDYLKNIKKYNFYTCFGKCSNIKKNLTFDNSYGKNNPDGKNLLNEKKKKSCLEKYGVEHQMYSKEIKDKIEKTCLKKYGVKNPAQSDTVKEKMKQTVIEHYGVEHQMYSNDVKDKIRQTNLEKYGKEYGFQSTEVKEKCKKTMLEKYGAENSSQCLETKNKKLKTCLKKFGVEYGFQSVEVKEKIKQTCLERYGVENPQQNIDIFNKQQKSAFQMKKFENLHYQGTYELDFLKKYYNKIKIENGMTIRYNDNKIYFPDFYIPDLNLIIEIKSDYTFDLEKEINLDKQKACLKQGYNFIFIIDKNYTEFEKLFFIQNIF